MRIGLPFVLGALCAAAIAGACAASKMAKPGAPPMASDAAPMGMASPRRAEIDELDRQIDQDLAAMSLARPAAPAACVEPACSAVQPMSIPASHADDPSCRPGPSEKCQSSCKFSDSICDASRRICQISDELAGDAYAKQKCESGTRSCQAAREACCGCL